MDKLQPLIKYHFWLLFIPAFLMPPLAWWMTTSDLQATIVERTDALESSYKLIPDGKDTANQDWIDKANDLIRIRTETNTRTGDRLWAWQKSLVKWPPNVASYMKTCPYRGAISDSAIARRVPIDYRRDYPREVRRVWLLSEPIGPATDPIPAKAPKKVWFPLSEMPQVPAEKWRNLPPSFIEIWNSQEDLWLLEQIMLAIRRTNSSSNSISDSFVRQIRTIELFGGDRVQDNEVPASGAAAASATGGAPMGAAQFGQRSGLSSKRKTPDTARFELSTEYKTKGLARSGGASSGEQDFSGAEAAEAASAAAGGSSTVEDLNLDENRYIAVEDAYRTRAFHIVVVVHQQYVPDLVHELLDSRFPIDIVRMEQVALNPDEPGGSSDPSGGPKNAFGPMAAKGGAAAAAAFGEGEADAIPDGEEGFDTEAIGDAFGEGETGPTSSFAPVTDEAVQAALEELELVELAIVGEMYLYNPPPVPEGEEPAAGAEAPPTGSPETPATVETPGTEPPGDVTGAPTTTDPAPAGDPAEATTTPAPAEGSQPETTPAAETPTTTPTETPAPATPKPATPKPATPEPAGTESKTPDPDAPPDTGEKPATDGTGTE